ncbi:hypothetical protein ACFZBU_10980 [Embleya sp. NPDC008237]|uniref:hypothetical protein n=1 Tax=Embleya sp. NPDC008237 TaxID=3363978 RepID=UPI0036F0B870
MWVIREWRDGDGHRVKVVLDPLRAARSDAELRERHRHILDHVTGPEPAVTDRAEPTGVGAFTPALRSVPRTRRHLVGLDDLVPGLLQLDPDLDLDLRPSA